MQPYIKGYDPVVLTMDQILDRYSDAFLDKILFLSILYAIFALYVWWNAKKLQSDGVTGRWLRIYLYFNVAVSLYFPVLMLGYKTGWFI